MTRWGRSGEGRKGEGPRGQRGGAGSHRPEATRSPLPPTEPGPGRVRPSSAADRTRPRRLAAEAPSDRPEGRGGAWVAARAGFVPLWKPHCSGRLFLNYRPGSCLCCILRSSLVQLLEAVGEDKPARRAEPSERSNVLAPTDVRNGVKNVF